MTDNDTPKIVALLEGQVADLKAQLDTATTENAQLLDLATRLQKQNEILDDSTAKAQTTLFPMVVVIVCYPFVRLSDILHTTETAPFARMVRGCPVAICDPYMQGNVVPTATTDCSATHDTLKVVDYIC